MESSFLFLSSLVVSIILFSIAIFQVLLSLGYPLGEYAMGGYHKILPTKLRILSALSALLLLMMGLVFLQHTNVIGWLPFSSTTTLVWVMTVFLGINTLTNLLSRSNKERFVMTPIACVTFFLSLLIALS